MDESLSLSSFTFLPCKMNVCAMRGFTRIIARLFETYRSMRTYGSVRRGCVKDGGRAVTGGKNRGKGGRSHSTMSPRSPGRGNK